MGVVVGGGGVAPFPRAMTGAVTAPTGLDVTIPVGSRLFGYVLQRRSRMLPDTSRLNWMAASWVTMMPPPDAVKGPIVAGDEGRLSGSPEGGTGEGMGTSKLMVPVDMDEGVAPEVSIDVVAVPLSVLLPRAAAAETMLEGRSTVVW